MIIIKDKVYNVKVAGNTIISMFKSSQIYEKKQERLSYIQRKEIL